VEIKSESELVEVEKCNLLNLPSQTHFLKIYFQDLFSFSSEKLIFHLACANVFKMNSGIVE